MKQLSQHKRHGRSESAISFSDSTASDAAAGHRHARLEHLIQEELNALLSFEVGDPDLEGVILTSAILSVDGGNVRLEYILPAHQEPDRAARGRIDRALERANGMFRHRLAEALNLKRTPALHFVFGTVADQAARTRALMAQLAGDGLEPGAPLEGSEEDPDGSSPGEVATELDG